MTDPKPTRLPTPEQYRALVAAGAHLIPVAGKVAKVPSGYDYSKPRMTPYAELERAGGAGIVPGSLDMLAIDIDDKRHHPGLERLLDHCDAEANAKTWHMVETAKGRHLFVRYPLSWGAVRQTKFALAGSGERIHDFRHARGYVRIVDCEALVELSREPLAECVDYKHVVAALKLDRIGEGARRDTCWRRVFDDPAVERAAYFAAVVDGVDPKLAKDQVAKALDKRKSAVASGEVLDPEGVVSLARHFARTLTMIYAPDMDAFYLFNDGEQRGWWRRDRQEVAYRFTNRFVWHLFTSRQIDGQLRRKLERSGMVADVLKQLERDPQIRRPGALLDADADLAGLPDGRVVHLPSGDILDPSPDQLVTRSWCFVPDFDRKPEAFLRYAAEAWPDDALNYILAFLRYSTTAHTNRHLALYAWGRPGTGKSTLGRLAEKLFGLWDAPSYDKSGRQQRPGYVGAIGKENIVDSKFADHPTWKECTRVARFVMVDDVPDKRLDEAMLNTLISGDTTGGRGMYQDASSLQPVSKFYLTSNHPPRASAGGGLMGRRLAVLNQDTKPARKDEGLVDALLAEASAIVGLILRTDFAALGSIPASMRVAHAEASAIGDPFRSALAELGWQEGLPSDHVLAKDLHAAMSVAGMREAGGGVRWVLKAARDAGFECKRRRDGAWLIYGIVATSSAGASGFDL